MTDVTDKESDAPAIEIDETLPEVVKNFLRKGAKLQEIRLDDRGQWHHEGLDFENRKIIGLFSRSVNRTAGGTWVLEVGRFTYPIVVDDTGFFVEHIDMSTFPPTLALSDETTEDLDPSTLSYKSGGRLYCTIKNGAFRARFLRNAYLTLADHMDEAEDGKVYLHLNGEKLFIADTSDRSEQD